MNYLPHFDCLNSEIPSMLVVPASMLYVCVCVLNQIHLGGQICLQCTASNNTFLPPHGTRTESLDVLLQKTIRTLKLDLASKWLWVKCFWIWKPYYLVAIHFLNQRCNLLIADPDGWHLLSETLSENQHLSDCELVSMTNGAQIKDGVFWVRIAWLQ